MLLDELLAERERVHVPATPPPVLSVDPVAVPQTIETGRKAIRQRLADLESAARRNYRSAEEARRVLADEHQRLEQELNARTHAQSEAAALRRELERLSTEEARRTAQERTRAEREARAEIAGELKRFQEEHERVVQEMAALRGSLTEHDGLLDEYVTRLREEQGARAALRAELERAEAARSLAERSLQRATENARHGAEDEMIRLATAEQELADTRSDRNRLAAQLAELTSGEGAIGRMTAQLEEKDTALGRLGVRVADLGARIDASEEAARDALAACDQARTAQIATEAQLREVVQARLEAEQAVAAADARTRELDKTLGKLRREARDASNARRTAEGNLATAESERDELRARVADLEAEYVRARADGDRLRAHAAMLGDELAAARATVAELQAAAPAHPVVAEAPAESLGAPPAPAPRCEESSEDSSQRNEEEPPPLPLRIAGRHAPTPQVVRRRARREPEPSAGPEPAPVVEPTMVEPAFRVAPDIAAIEDAPEPVAVVADAPEDASPEQAEPPATAPAPAEETHRRTALAAFTALATSSGDDLSYRRR
ncbi:MAG TPA: hypothetical protein VGP92_18845 [Acidimicrobiia bacterium]|nr:hypothetical protein [Acidimicrobiia bacterium]